MGHISITLCIRLLKRGLKHSNMEWRTKNGRVLNVDDMDNTHVRNAFKMLIRQHAAVIEQYNALVKKHNSLINKHKQPLFQVNGDMAEEFNQNHMSDEDDDEQFNPFI